MSMSTELDRRIQTLVERVEQSGFWEYTTSPDRSPREVQAVMREVYLEIVWYQPDVIEATMAVIGQMPRTLAPRDVQSMLLHQVEEWDHGEMALRDYVALGGDEEHARTSRMSPSAFAVAAYWRMLAHHREPFAYLGALYLFEGLTPIISGEMKRHLAAKDYPQEALEYIDFHATEDIKHQNLVRHLVDSVAEKYPESRESMLHGYDCFEHVYPIPAWGGAVERARRQSRALQLTAS